MLLPMPAAPSTSPTPPLTMLVHRPGRMVAIVATAILVLGGVAVLALQLGVGVGRGWWSLAIMVPVVAGYLAIMRTGATRCEVEISERELVLRSVDSSRLLGASREVSYTWDEVRGATWVGRQPQELRLDFDALPKALVFAGARRGLEMLATAAGSARH